MLTGYPADRRGTGAPGRSGRGAQEGVRPRDRPHNAATREAEGSRHPARGSAPHAHHRHARDPTVHGRAGRSHGPPVFPFPELDLDLDPDPNSSPESDGSRTTATTAEAYAGAAAAPAAPAQGPAAVSAACQTPADCSPAVPRHQAPATGSAAESTHLFGFLSAFVHLGRARPCHGLRRFSPRIFCLSCGRSRLFLTSASDSQPSFSECISWTSACC